MAIAVACAMAKRKPSTTLCDHPVNHNAHGPSSYANDPLAIAPHSDQIDVIFAAVDGGGLVAGIADYVKRIGSPHTKVTGVEADGSQAVCV